MRSSAYNASVAKTLLFCILGCYSWMEVHSVRGGFPRCRSQRPHTSGRSGQRDIRGASRLGTNTNDFNLVENRTGASFLHQRVDLALPVLQPFSSKGVGSKSDHLCGVVCISRVLPDSQIITPVNPIQAHTPTGLTPRTLDLMSRPPADIIN